MTFRAPAFRTRIFTNFYPRCDEMRDRYDGFFRDPHLHDASHQVWDFWHIPDHYCYLRAQAARIIGDDLFADFQSHVNQFARGLGLNGTTGSFLSIYVNGCFQTTHSDQLNGTYGWVYSLTRWDVRKFVGGETYVAKPGAFEELEPRMGRAATSYWECLEPCYGQLTLFDDRVAHMVPMIQGGMNPLEARVVLHGHLI